jgi:hypothetical protein
VIATVDWDALLTVIWSAALAGTGATAAYGLAILGTSRAVDLGRDGRVGEAVVYAVIGVVGMTTVIAAVVYGIVVISSK